MEDETREERLLEKVLERLDSLESTAKQPGLTQWIPVYLALAGLFFSAANVYTGISTRLALLEQQVNIVKDLVIKDTRKP